MSSVETTEMKLKTTPTGGVDASHSPYYRRLLSAGYKGYLQGTIGGASLYGVMGMVIGGLVAVPLLFTPVGWAALALIPAAAGVGLAKGASTFGQIGSTAATLAESADLTEQRRYLLDRYYDLPEGPEGDREAEAIKKELLRAHDSAIEAPPFFHWKTVAVCATVGALLALAVIAAAAIPGALPIIGHMGVIEMIHSAIGLGIGHAAAAGAIGMTAGAALGALTGAVVGIDRYYIRKWFDHTEGVVHSSSHKESALIERSQQVGRLKTAAKADEQTKAQLDGEADRNEVASSPATALAPKPTIATISQLDAAEATAKLTEKPDTKISDATLKSRLADIQKIMEIPAI